MSTALEYRLSPANDVWYWKWGVPFNLKGKDDDTKVNIEHKLDGIAKRKMPLLD
ncbi:MAG: hypothetical protein RIC35_24660 [Marinoscillum sp.]